MKASRILIIDQDDAFIRNVQTYFEALGVDVISAEEGTAGYRLAKTTDPGLIVLDTILPNLNGFQICHIINKNGNIFPKEGIKGYKSILNLLRTLKPITFNVQPKNKKDGPGFTIQPFNIIDEKTTFINPLFEDVFFSPVYQVKKILNAK